MNTITISLGSNENSEPNLKLCRELLRDLFEQISFSNTSTTKPFGTQYKNDFRNQLALAYSDQELEDVIYNLKLIEKQIGRTATDKDEGKVKIDADVVKWNDTILKKEDWNRSYVANLLESLFENNVINHE